MVKLKKINKVMKLIVLIAALFLVISLTYAFFSSNIIGNETATTITAGSANMSIHYSGGPALASNNIVPSYDPFTTKTFTVTGTNETDNSMGYIINLVIDVNTFTSGAISYTLTATNTGSNGTTAPSQTERTVVGGSEVFLGVGKFTGGAVNKVHTYELKLYFYETGENQNEDMGKQFGAHINITDIACVDCLKDNIIAQAGGATALSAKTPPNFTIMSPRGVYIEKSKEVVLNTRPSSAMIGDSYETDLSRGIFKLENEYTYYSSFTTADIGKYFCDMDSGDFDSQKYNCIKIYKIKNIEGGMITNATEYSLNFKSYDYSDIGIFASEDEYGTSYYYRGATDALKNNLIFAEYQWKIVRINGDGSIRLINNGTCQGNNCAINTQGIGTTIGNSEYNAVNTDNRHAGYMFGNSAETKEAAQTNTNNSTVKSLVDNWYLANIHGTQYASKIVDNIFCNDRQLTSEVGGSVSGTGAGLDPTDYASYYRLQQQKSPTLKCGKKNDRFTVSDTTKGNGALTYPVGLLTADEAWLSGHVRRGDFNINNYLYNALDYWLLTPLGAGPSSGGLILSYKGYIYEDTYDEPDYYVRPVINLSSTVKITGDGSLLNPFKVVS